MTNVISTVSNNQHEIIKNIISLHCPDGIDVDPTYSKGVFYKSQGGVAEPRMKFDINPQAEGVIKSDANHLPLPDGSVKTMMFDPPFICGHTKDKPSGIIGERFFGFRYVKDLWKWYDECLDEFYRVLAPRTGTLIFKCQDTVSSGRQHLSHVHIINKAESLGFYTKDLFILVANSRLIGHNHANQQHARKFHSYFLVFRKDR